MFVCLFKSRIPPLPDESNPYMQWLKDYMSIKIFQKICQKISSKNRQKKSSKKSSKKLSKKIVKKNCQKNSSKNSSGNSSKKFVIRNRHRFGQINLAKNFVKNFVKIWYLSRVHSTASVPIFGTYCLKLDIR